MNKWLVIVILAVIVVAVAVWVSNRDEPDLSPATAKKTVRTTTPTTKTATQQQIMGKVPVAPDNNAFKVFGVSR
ncbi:MAG: hypothetical protein AABY16_04470 [Nanoarchaeota archaeon]